MNKLRVFKRFRSMFITWLKNIELTLINVQKTVKTLFYLRETTNSCIIFSLKIVFSETERREFIGLILIV